MSMIVTPDIANGTTAKETPQGFEATRAFLVVNPDGNASNKAANAINAGGIPALYDFHPAFTDIQCVNKSVSPQSENKFIVSCQYKTIGGNTNEQEPDAEDQVIVNISAVTQSVQTTNDKNGDVIKVGNQDLTGDFPGEQTGTVNKLTPQIIVSFTRKETENPSTNVRLYVGKVNSANFLNLEKRKVLCTGITADSQDSGETYTVTYNFQIDLDEWTTDVFWLNKDDRPEPNATKDNGGQKNVELYEEVDFTQLGLTT